MIQAKFKKNLLVRQKDWKGGGSWLVMRKDKDLHSAGSKDAREILKKFTFLKFRIWHLKK